MRQASPAGQARSAAGADRKRRKAAPRDGDLLDGAIAELKALARPLNGFDPDRYFRSSVPTTFLNTGTPAVRALARRIAREHRDSWTLGDALAFANALVADQRFEAKALGIETLACFRRLFTPSQLAIWKRWLASDHAANWATTDAICGSLIGPLLVVHPDRVPVVVPWTRHRNLWVRRAAAVSLIKLAARGQALDAVYDVATALRPDTHDLIHKAVGWLLREAGKTDPDRLERYLRNGGGTIPRTTVRYAIERFAPKRRQAVLDGTRRRRLAPAR